MESIDPKDYIVFDAKSKVIGRVASVAAKELLNGKNVAVLNVDESIISGNRKDILARYHKRLILKEKANPEHSPYWPRRTDMLFKRIVRGMLPYRRPRGKAAYRKLRVFSGTPELFEKSEIKHIDSKNSKDIFVNTMTLKRLSELLGYSKE